MTATQKTIITALLQGGNIAHLGASGIRLRDSQLNPLVKVNARTFWAMRNLLKRRKNLWVISRAAVIKLHGGSWIKQEYKRLQAIKK